MKNVIELNRILNGRKILHFGSLAGWPMTMAQVSRRIGIESINVIHEYKDVADLDRKLPYDVSLFEKKTNIFKKIFIILKFIHQVPRKYCLIHYHSSNFLHREIHWIFEGPYLKYKKIPMVLSLGGGDARIVKDALSLNKYFYRKENRIRDFLIKLRWMSWRKNVDVCATDPEMSVVASKYFDNIVIFRQPIDLENFVSIPPDPNNKKPLVLHVPTEPWVKGTREIELAVLSLKSKGFDFDFRLVRGLTQKEFHQELSKCDIYVDELKCGSHGVTAVEAMAMGKPTISFIRDDLKNIYPENLPIVNANPDTIESVLMGLIIDSELRNQIGCSSRLYVERYHDAEVVINEIAKTYIGLLKQ
jgi:glycosyltransferase involved in cell wall biosynthesis